LGYKNAIKGISVMQRKTLNSPHMRQQDGKHSHRGSQNLRLEVFVHGRGQVQLADARLYQDFPNTAYTQQKTVSPVIQ
jgi:hypothetical protein